jgi:ribosome recycling factor
MPMKRSNAQNLREFLMTKLKTGEGDVQKLTDSCIIRIDRLMEAKEKDIMTV